MAGRRRRAKDRTLTEPPAGSLVDIYARYSSDMQDGVSLVTQVNRCRAVAEQRGWVVRQVWEEPAVSAKYDLEDLSKRPQFAALIAAAERGEVQAILCWKSDRWARNITMSSATLRQLRAAGVWWATADGEFDIERIRRGTGKLTHTIKAALDEQYIDTLSDHVVAGKQTRAEQGYYNGSVIPFGYLMPDYPQRPEGAPATWKPPRTPMRLDSAAADIVRKIGEWYVEGYSQRDVAKLLNQQGYRRKMYGRIRSKYYPDQTEVPWDIGGVYSVLKCTLYREFAPGTGQGTIIDANGVAHLGQHPAIWDYDLWQRIEVVRVENTKLRSGYAVTERYPFARHIRCAGCGRPMRAFQSAHATSTTSRYHQCMSKSKGVACSQQRTISNASVIEAAFGRLLLTYRLGDTWQADLRQLIAAVPVTTYWDEIAGQRAALEREVRALNTMLRAGAIEEAEYLKEVGMSKARLAALPTQPTTTEDTALRAGQALDALPEAWRDATTAERRTIVASLLGSITWSHDRQCITAIAPLPEYLPSLALMLVPRGWVQDGEALRCERADPSIEVPQPGGKLTLTQQLEVRRKAAAGVSHQELAREYEVHNATIWRIVNKPRKELRMMEGQEG